MSRLYIYIYYDSAHSTAITVIKFRSDLHSRTAPHSSPVRASYGVSFLSYTERNGREISKLHFIYHLLGTILQLCCVYEANYSCWCDLVPWCSHLVSSLAGQLSTGHGCGPDNSEDCVWHLDRISGDAENHKYTNLNARCEIQIFITF